MANRGSFPNIATLNANQSMLTSLVSGDTVTVAGVVYTWDGTGWGSPTPSDLGDWVKTPSGAYSLAGPLEYADGLSHVGSPSLDLPKWRKALLIAATGGKRARIALVGDSTIAAVGNNGDSTARAGDFDRSIGRYMADFLPSRLGLEVRRDSVWGTQNLTKAQVRPGGYDPRVTQTAGVDEDAINTVGGRAIKFVNPADEVTFTPGASTDSTFILHTVGAQASWGAIDVYVDDVLITTISAAAGTGHTVTTVATAGEVLKLVNKTQGNNQFDLIGIEAYQASARQVQILQMGWSGSKIASHANSSASWRHLPVLATIAPDLVIIKCTTNDSLDTDTAAKREQYLADLTTVVNSAKTYADVIFADCFPSQYSDDDPSILDFYRQCAEGLGLPVIDLRAMFGTTSAQALATGLALGNIHPGEIGYATIGKMYSERISPWW